MAEPTDEMKAAVADVVNTAMRQASRPNAAYSPPHWHRVKQESTDEILAAVLPIAERDLRAEIAYRIRAELVCCDLYERTHASPAWEKASEGPHAICYWSEAAARVALAGER